jgi:lysophospholipase L1-like esterase
MSGPDLSDEQARRAASGGLRPWHYLALAILVLTVPLLIWNGTRPSAESLPGGVVADPCSASIEAALAHVDPRVRDFGGLCRYRDDDRRLIQSRAPVRVVMLGDSITEGWAAADPGLFSNGVVNRGVSGQTSSQVLVRFRQDVIDLHPAAVHILIGTNDVAGNTGPTTLDDIVGNIRSMIELARANHIRVILGAVLPTDHYFWAPERRPARQIAEMNRRLAALAQAEGIVFVDYYSALANRAGGLDKPDAADGVHPSANGYSRMRPLTVRALSDVLSGSASPADTAVQPRRPPAVTRK